MNRTRFFIISVTLIAIMFISNFLTNIQMQKLEANGEIAFGPQSIINPPNYIFNGTSTLVLSHYPVGRIQEFSKNDFEEIILKSLDQEDQVNLKIHLKKILTVSEEYQLDPFWVLSIIQVESRFLSKARSHKNAQGLMQILPETASHVYQMMNKDVDDNDLAGMLGNADVNLDVGAFYLKKLLQNFRHNFKNATIAYNVGPAKLKNLIESDNINTDNNHYYGNVVKNYNKYMSRFQTEVAFKSLFLNDSFIVQNSSENRKAFFN